MSRSDDERIREVSLYRRPSYSREATRRITAVRPPAWYMTRAWAMKQWQPTPALDNVASGFYRPAVK